MAVGSTFNSTITRNRLIELAFIEVNQLEVGGILDQPRLQWGIERLNIILRRMDGEKRYIWTVTDIPSTLTLVANTFKYTSDNGLPVNIKRLIQVNYRDAAGVDTELEIIRPEDFALLSEKITLGDPKRVYLSEHRDIGSQRLYVHPTLNAVNTADVALNGGVDYQCIRNHTAASLNEPGVGADYLLYWEALATAAGDAWVTATSYLAAQHLRLWYERPLFDFTSASDNPDVPQEWNEVLLHEMAEACATFGGAPIDERLFFNKRTKATRDKIAPAQIHKATNLHNKAKYF